MRRVEVRRVRVGMEMGKGRGLLMRACVDISVRRIKIINLRRAKFSQRSI